MLLLPYKIRAATTVHFIGLDKPRCYYPTKLGHRQRYYKYLRVKPVVHLVWDFLRK